MIECTQNKENKKYKVKYVNKVKLLGYHLIFFSKSWFLQGKIHDPKS